jgi:hypothetical protein
MAVTPLWGNTRISKKLHDSKMAANHLSAAAAAYVRTFRNGAPDTYAEKKAAYDAIVASDLALRGVFAQWAPGGAGGHASCLVHAGHLPNHLHPRAPAPPPPPHTHTPTALLSFCVCTALLSHA